MVVLDCGAVNMFYLVLARRTASTLFTLDKEFQRICCEVKVNCIEMGDRF